MKHVPDEQRVHPRGAGMQRLYRFPNGYGASAVRFKLPHLSWPGREYFSYTNNEQEWEVAVVRLIGDSGAFRIVYDTPITSDVVGHVADADLDALLDRIAALPSCREGVGDGFAHGNL